MKVLVINSGSSSIKYQVFDAVEFSVLATGLLERIGEHNSRLVHRWRESSGSFVERIYGGQVSDHRQGLILVDTVIEESGIIGNRNELSGIGHRVVHGGEIFHEPVLIDNTVVDSVRRLLPLAPLHNPANLMGIEASLEHMPDVPQVAVFDTSFHQTMPEHAFLYALPYELYTEHHVRRYGFHGTSHQYVANRAAGHLGRPLLELDLITLHLGNGASAAALKGGKSIDTSMGMTPLEGLIMGTRCGDIDPAIQFYLSRSAGKTSDELESLLNHESGLLGICGANDMREIQRSAEQGNKRARLAITMFCYRIKKYIGAYYAVLGRVDAIVFTGGIGENASQVRKGSCEGLDCLGIMIDDDKNKLQYEGVFEIQRAEGQVKLLVVPTNEELAIARQTMQIISASGVTPKNVQ
ncbi:MAG: acetate kinase [Nitrospirae bacterium]|nr:acetate kinase [Nitrospirota bacterium]